MRCLLLASLALMAAACGRRAPTRAEPVVHRAASAGSATPIVLAPSALPSASVALPATVQRVPVPGDLSASLVAPAAGGPPRLVFLPGLCSSGYGYLGDFPEAARRHGGALAIEGETPCGAADSAFRTFTRDPETQHRRITAALVAAGVTVLPREGLTLIGYSLGGAIAEQLVRRYPNRYTRLILIGTPREPVAANSREARGVVTMACSLDVTSRMKQGAASIARTGVPATYLEMPGCIHGNLADGDRVFDQALRWLDDRSRPVREGATDEPLARGDRGRLAGGSIWRGGHGWRRPRMPRCGMKSGRKRAGIRGRESYPEAMLRRYSWSLRSLAGLALVASVAVVGCGDDDDDSGAAGSAGTPGVSPLCAGVTAPCVAFAAGTTEQDISEAIVSATAGTTFVFGEGTFAFTNTVSVGTANVTIRGQGMDKTVLDFKGQVAGAEGLNVQDVAGFTIEDIHVRDTRGDGVKVTGGNGVTFRRLRVEFTAANATSRGAYGIYPVQCDNVLIENSEAIGASDAGIYVGQSRTIVVRKNTARGNVAGIEIENCYNADVTENTATENVGGILVFDLPGLPQLGGHDVRLFKNQIVGNNTVNFAPAGNIVGLVPGGTGVLVMANRNVEVFDNDIKDNQTAALAVASYAVSLKPITDDKYYQWPREVYVHDNRFSGNGKAPDKGTTIGGILATEFPPPGAVPELLIDGNKDTNATSDHPGNPQVLCFKNNTGDGAGQKAAFSDLAFPDFGDKKSSDITPFTCELTPVAAVVLPSN